jgi:putative endonuclease
MADFYWVYILRVRNGNYYTGFTSDLSRRYREHLTGRGRCKYTKMFRPVGIEQCWKIFDTRSTAMKIEKYIKRRKRDKKTELIVNPQLLKNMLIRDLNLEVRVEQQDPGTIEEEENRRALNRATRD